jgi:hypothetical protein
VRNRRLSHVDAAKQLGLTPRHISRLVNAFERDGPAALVSKRRGRRSNHAYADVLKTRVLDLVRERYADFGPTLIAEKLAEELRFVDSETTFDYFYATRRYLEHYGKPVAFYSYANAFLPGFIDGFNARFAKTPAGDQGSASIADGAGRSRRGAQLAGRPHGLQ